jgi:hypothetical protein
LVQSSRSAGLLDRESQPARQAELSHSRQEV